VGVGISTHIVLDRLSPSGDVLWESRLGGEYSPLATTFLLGSNSRLSIGPDGTLYILAFMGLPGDERGWMPAATPSGDPIPPAKQRRETSWPYQPFAPALRLLSETHTPLDADSAPHEARYALVDKRGRLIRAWRVLSQTDLAGSSLVPQRVGGDLVVGLGVTPPAGAAGGEICVLRLGSHGVRRSLSLRPGLWDGSFAGDLRIAADGQLYQLVNSPSLGVVISRYSLSPRQQQR
jgi:hypothetical protein